MQFFNTHIINKSVCISHFEIARIFGVNAALVAHALDSFALQNGQSSTVFVAPSDVLPLARFALAPAFRAFAAALLSDVMFDQTQVSNVIAALELKLSDVEQVS
jgi:hypothetical protein